MLDEMHVRDVALIRDAVMRPSAGLTVLTGETGAGKTALLSACKLLMGERADKNSVREGAQQATVEGRFFLRAVYDDDGGFGEIRDDAEGEDSTVPDKSSGIRDALAAGVGVDVAANDVEGVEIVVKRRLSADGRSRITVNGNMSSVSELSALIGPAVDLCGQHEQQILMHTAKHGELLDAWAHDEVAKTLGEYRLAYDRACAAQHAWEQIQLAKDTSEAVLEEARFTLRQIDSVGADEDEYDDLIAYLDKAEHAEALAQAINDAYGGLSGDAGAIDKLNSAVKALSDALRYDDSVGGWVESLQDAGSILEDVGRDLASYRDDIDYDPSELARAQERILAIQGLMRSYGPRFKDVLAHREEAFEIVSSADDSEERESKAKAELEEAEEALEQVATRLHEIRCACAPQFAKEVSAIMGSLEMGTAELLCDVELLPRPSWNVNGSSSVEFLFRPASGMQARPLARIASGGEISRVMLALHVVLGDKDGVSTLVFDEVDAGIGGAVAASLADVLSDLSRTHQVIVVTHLAQIAAHADIHYVVEKSDDIEPVTSLHEVEGESRIVEIARMLSGDSSEVSLALARELLDNAEASAALC